MSKKKYLPAPVFVSAMFGLAINLVVTLIFLLIHYNELLSFIDRHWWVKPMILGSMWFLAYLMIWLKKTKMSIYSNIEWVFGLTICYVSLSALHDIRGILTFCGGFFVVIRGTDNWFTDWQKD